MLLPNFRITAPGISAWLAHVSDACAQARPRESRSLWPGTALSTRMANLYSFLPPWFVSENRLISPCKMLVSGTQLPSVDKS